MVCGVTLKRSARPSTLTLPSVLARATISLCRGLKRCIGCASALASHLFRLWHRRNDSARADTTEARPWAGDFHIAAIYAQFAEECARIRFRLTFVLLRS